MSTQPQDFLIEKVSPRKLPRITDEQVAEANTIFSDLTELGWSKNAVEKRLSWPSGEFSRLTLGRCSQLIANKRMEELREFHNLAELGPNTQNTPVSTAQPSKALPVRTPVSNGVLDELVYAERLRNELENALVRAEQRCLPLLRLGLRSAITKIRSFKDDIRVG